MRLPKAIKIGGVSYRVRLAARVVSEEGKRLAGQIDYQKRTISFDREYVRTAGDVQALVLHEVLHGVAVDRDVRLPERRVDQLARGLQEVIVNNGWTLRFGRGRRVTERVGSVP